MTATVPTEHALALAAVLFALGLVGLVSRRNLVFMLISLEILLNAAALAFIAAGASWRQPDGQIMFIFILTLAAAEVAIALALILHLNRRLDTLDADALRELGS